MQGLKNALEPVVKAILERASKDGFVTDNDLILILAYQKECKETTSSIIDSIIKNGNKIIENIDKIMGGKE